MQFAPLDRSKLANTAEEYLALLKSDADWFARNADDVAELRSRGAGPFARLSDDAFQQFASSLTFTQGYLEGGQYGPLMSLTLTDIREVFAWLGIGPQLMLSIEDRKCENNNCDTEDPRGFCITSICSLHVQEPFPI
jgi:hypothetical protein